jgi:hypothetical protein
VIITQEDYDGIDEFLEHHGVKGQKWGVRRAEKKAARQQNRMLNKASREKDIAQRNAEIDAARARFKSGQARADFLNAKAQFHQDKVTMGSREARRILNETKMKNIQDGQVAQQAKSGKETAAVVLLSLGAIAIGALATSGASRRR